MKKKAFGLCTSIKKIIFPNSLEVIKKDAFQYCISLYRVVFHHDSRLKRIESAFSFTKIKELLFPPSVEEIFDPNDLSLKSVFISNKKYQSNPERTAIFSSDGSELVFVIMSFTKFKIPNNVRIIKKKVFYSSSISEVMIKSKYGYSSYYQVTSEVETGHLTIPASVEIIEIKAFEYAYNLKIIEFEEGSKLKSLAFDSLPVLEDLIINNENFVKKENGVVISLNPKAIVFVPRQLTELLFDFDVEVIYSRAFFKINIKKMVLPKSLKIICSMAFEEAKIESLEFEEGTVLDSIEYRAFYKSKIEYLKLPLIKRKLSGFSLEAETIEFPPDFSPSFVSENSIECKVKHVICPISSLQAMANIIFSQSYPDMVIID